MNLAGKHYKIEEKIRLTMPYKIFNEQANVPNKEIVLPADIRTRSKHGHTFYIMTNKTNEYKYSFFQWTISQWNCLPKALVDSETVDAFTDVNSPSKWNWPHYRLYSNRSVC